VNALKTAIYNALSGISAPVYDHVPQGGAFPYVVIDYMDAANAEFLNNRKEQILVYLSVYSTYRGQTEVFDIMSEIDTIMHNNRLSLSSGRLASMRVLAKDTNREPDGITYMGRVRLSALFEHG